MLLTNNASGQPDGQKPTIFEYIKMVKKNPRLEAPKDDLILSHVRESRTGEWLILECKAFVCFVHTDSEVFKQLIDLFDSLIITHCNEGSEKALELIPQPKTKVGFNLEFMENKFRFYLTTDKSGIDYGFHCTMDAKREKSATKPVAETTTSPKERKEKQKRS